MPCPLAQNSVRENCALCSRTSQRDFRQSALFQMHCCRFTSSACSNPEQRRGASVKRCTSASHDTRANIDCSASTTNNSNFSHVETRKVSASALPRAEDQASTANSDPAVGAAKSSSSDGLGIHEPGSNTRGDRSAMTAPSGRALESANCPAVTRFSPHPGSHAAVSTFHQPGVTETAATNSLGIVGERCEAFPISAGLAARLSVGSASESASVRPAGSNFTFDCRGDDPAVLKKIATFRARAKNSISATSSSS